MDHIKDLATKFVRVRLARIDEVDLNLFEFDYDLTFAVFFLNAQEQIYARYGGRDAADSESRMSLAGLRYTMKLVLDGHREKSKNVVDRNNKTPLFARQLIKYRKSSGCIHCHEAKEMIYGLQKDKAIWRRDSVWRYPLPKNLGFTLEVDRGNIIKRIDPKSPAEKAGLQVGDLLVKLNDVPVRSMADARFGLDSAPTKGTLHLEWKRAGKIRTGSMALPSGWRKTDITWRASVWRLVPRLYLFGKDLSVAEKKQLGLSVRQTAFRPASPLSAQARSAGVREGDIVLGVDDKKLELDARALLDHVRLHYVIGDCISINVLRDGKRLRLPLKMQ